MEKYVDKECRNGHGLVRHILQGRGYYRCTKCSYEAIARHRIKVKEKLVAYKGGSCESCGYNRCLEVLEFHHKDPSKKDFEIGRDSCKAIAKLYSEVDKCLLLCANCHREEHVRLKSFKLD